MKLENFIVAVFIIVLFLTLVNIEPFHTGHFVMPSPISLEASLLLIALSIFIIAIIILRNKGYTPILDRFKPRML